MRRALHSVAVCNDEGLRGSGGASGTNVSVGIFCVTGKAVTYKAREPAPRSPSGRGQRAGCWRYGEEVKVALFGAELDCALERFRIGAQAGMPVLLEAEMRVASTALASLLIPYPALPGWASS